MTIEKVNEVYLKISTEPHIEYELRDKFTFEVPNMKFILNIEGGHWNGEIHLFDMRTKRIYVGLLDKVVAFCENQDIVLNSRTISSTDFPLKSMR